MKARPPRWETRDIMFFTRDEGTMRRLLAPKLRCFGELAVHPAEPVVHRTDPERPETWTVSFKHSSNAHRQWLVTHAHTGMTISRGPKGRGYTRKGQVRELAELLMEKFGDVLSVRAPAHSDGTADLILSHPRADDMLAFIRQHEAEVNHRSE